MNYFMNYLNRLFKNINKQHLFENKSTYEVLQIEIMFR